MRVGTTSATDIKRSMRAGAMLGIRMMSGACSCSLHPAAMHSFRVLTEPLAVISEHDQDRALP